MPRARFLPYLESPVATLHALFFFLSFIFSSFPFAAGRPHAAQRATKSGARIANGPPGAALVAAVTSLLRGPLYPLARVCVHTCVHACAHLRFARNADWMHGRSVGPTATKSQGTTYAKGKGEKDGEDENNGTNARASRRAKRKPARGAPSCETPRVGPMDPSADPGAARSLWENRSGSVGERSQAGLTGKHGYLVIWSRFSIFSFITDPFSFLQTVLIDLFQLINRYFPAFQ